MAELRLAGIDDRDGADAFLVDYLPRHDERSMVPALEPMPAWRPLPAGLPIERVCCFKYRRTVARDGTVRAGATMLQLPAKANGRSRAGQKVELHLRLDGRMAIWDGTTELLTTPAPLDAVQLRALHAARVEVGSMPPSAARASTPAHDHPWRRVRPGTELRATIEDEQRRRTDPLTS